MRVELRLWVCVCEAVRVPEAVSDCVAEGVIDCVTEAVSDSLGVGDPEALEDRVCVSEGVPDGEGVPVPDPLGVPLALGDADCVPETLCEVVSEADGDNVADLVPDEEVVWVWLELSVALCVWLPVTLCVLTWLGLPERLPVDVPEGVLVSDAVSEALRLCVNVGDCDCEGESVKLCDWLGVGEVLGECVDIGVSDCVPLREPLGVAVTLLVCVSDADSVSVGD